MHKESREWCGVNEFPDYEVSNDGLVRRIVENGHRLIKIRKKKNGYMEAKLYRDGKRKYLLVHRLVCAAFNGVAPSENHEVNHDDGDKENNLYTNLEWTTVKGNRDHALDTGLSKHSYKIIVHNIVEKTCQTYRSINDVRKEFGVSKRVVENCLRGYPNLIYNKFYKFELLYNEDTTSVRKDGQSIRVMDYVKGTEFISESKRLASYLTGVGENAVQFNLGNNRMVNGFMFKSVDDLSPFIPYPVDAALLSKDDFSKGIRIENKVTVTAIHSGVSQVYNSAKEAALLLRIPIVGIYNRLRQASNEPYKGYSFKRMTSY